MQSFLRVRRKGQVLLSLFVALAVAVSVMFTAGTGTASAAVGYGQITHVYMNLGERGSQTQQSQYQGLLDSLRNAVGNYGPSPWRGGTYLAQYAQQGLVRLSLHRNATAEEVSLWIDPVTLYVLGFSNNNGQIWQFPDNTVANFRGRLDAAGYSYTSFANLPFQSQYASMTASAGVDRWNFNHNYGDILGSVSQLARVTNPYGGQNNGSDQMWTARSLLLLIQATAEAARLWDIQGVFRTTFLGAWAGSGISAYQQNLENGWGQASAYGYSVTNSTNTPGITTTGGITWNSWQDVADRIAVLLGRNITPDGGNSANFQRDEL
ncbi:MAG TPA: ribosome-inactivating family protein [Candidatus Acidoferrum sp.]|nr:ribosome-inactivating family protein [Candidatus Acidoferrum sp.]